MKALRSFSVRTVLPPPLTALERLAMNLRWSWDEPTRELFRWVDPDGWDVTRHDPVSTLAQTAPERLEQLGTDEGFLRYLSEVDDELRRYVQAKRWFQLRPPGPLRSIVYFSPEFGISEALPQYSGGLGILAGDHLKAASDLGVPLVGVGLFYGEGYFRQRLSLDGWQEERYPQQDPYAMAVQVCDGVRVSVDLAGQECHARVWRADVGRTPLYLLDTDIDENQPELRGVTDRLYGGDTEHRLRQEIVLGIGGVRALQALGIEAQVFHTNEGHAGFLGFERIRQQVASGLTWAEALEATRAGTIFTTHTPVPAGIDRFPRPLIERYFGSYATECRVDFPTLFALGQRDDEPDPPGDERFNMAVMGLRLAGRANGVAALHGKVSRAMFQGLWPDVPEDEVPITSVTNGVHALTWVSPEMDDLLTRHVRPDWVDASPDEWERINSVRDDELWRVKEVSRDRMVTLVREKLKAARLAQGMSDVSWCDGVLDPKVLTIGFARRFATYKRANLLLSQPERLKDLLLSADRPVQFVFAGKAHPADNNGKDLIQQIQRFASELQLRHRFVYLEDYDIAIARALYQGADVWLNTPRRPLEACGTSGMKAALNGTLNCSTLDGWWDEWFDGANGWAIASAEQMADLAHRDQIEADSLFDLVENQIVPMFYVRSEGPVPRRWIARVKHDLASLGPKVVASRMVREYTTRLYEPAAAASDAALASNAAAAKALASWKAGVLEGWPGVKILDVSSSTGAVEVGGIRAVQADVVIDGLAPGDVQVQLVHGSVGPNDELTDVSVVPMEHAGTTDNGAARYEGSFTCSAVGRYGFTVRVLPYHPGLQSPVELGRIAWA